MRVCELRLKEVVNIEDCKCLGCVADILFDPCSGCITDLVVPGPGKICGLFGRDTEYIIPWKQIIKIGPEIILVKICEDKFKKPCC